MRRFEDALFHQTELIRLMDTTVGHRLFDAFEDHMRRIEFEGDNFNLLPKGTVWHMTRRTLDGADPVYISPQIADMLEFAMPSFNPEAVVATDLFTAQGFAVLPRGILIKDASRVMVPIRAIAWMPIRSTMLSEMSEGGLWLSYFTHRDDDEEMRDLSPEEIAALRSIKHGSLTLTHSWFMPYNADAWSAITSERHREACEDQWRLVQVLWRLASQVVRSVTLAPRHVRRDAKRHGLERDNVTVIQLRKVSHLVTDGRPDDSESDGEHYSVQFQVRGHWRNQWYPSVAKHRQIWIDGYVKGPEWAPFRPTDRVFELIR